MAEKSDVTIDDVIIEAALADFTEADLIDLFKGDYKGQILKRVRSAESWIKKNTGKSFSPLREEEWQQYNDMVLWYSALRVINVLLRNIGTFTSAKIEGMAEVDFGVTAANLRAAKNDIQRELNTALEAFLEAAVESSSCREVETTII